MATVLPAEFGQALLGRDLREAERLVCLLLAGYGGLEAVALGVALEGEGGQVLSGCADYVSGCVAQLLAASF
jgi:hypothetical protein